MKILGGNKVSLKVGDCQENLQCPSLEQIKIKENQLSHNNVKSADLFLNLTSLIVPMIALYGTVAVYRLLPFS
jgi:hypothetical protein